MKRFDMHGTPCANGLYTTYADALAELKRFIDKLAPDHCRTSCSDEASNGNEFCNEYGYPRCIRCALLYQLRNGEFPDGAEARIESLRYGVEG